MNSQDRAAYLKKYAGFATEIVPGLFIGNANGTSDRETLPRHDIGAAISLVIGPCALWRSPKFTDYVKPGRHFWVVS